MYKYVSDEIDTDLIFFPSPLPAQFFRSFSRARSEFTVCARACALVHSFTRLRAFACVCVSQHGRASVQTDRRTVAQKRWKNERTNERNSGGKEIVNERGRRRNNIWPACKFPFGRKQAASRGGKARREHDENKCVYRDRRRPISAITLCLLYTVLPTYRQLPTE